MKTQNTYSPEVRERAVRMVEEHRPNYSSLWATIESLAPNFGCGPQTLYEWRKRAQIEAGEWPGTATEQAERFTALGRENKELPAQTRSCIRPALFSPRRRSTAS